MFSDWLMDFKLAMAVLVAGLVSIGAKVVKKRRKEHNEEPGDGDSYWI